MIGAVLTAFMLAATAIYFVALNLGYGLPDFGYYTLCRTIFVLLLYIPVLTMRSFAEERHSRTDQLLLTSPVSVGGIVLGKYFALCVIFALPCLVDAGMILVLKALGATGTSTLANFSALLCYYLMGCAAIAIGVFLSSLTENQIIAAVSGVAALLLALAVLGGAAYVTVTVLQLITQLAVNAACDLMQLKINTAVRASMAQVRGEYYTYRTDADGTITAVSIDAERVGQVASLVLEHMMDGDDGQIELDIPLETLFGVNFLPGLKLPLPVRILVLTTSDVRYRNELMSAAINQSKYQLYLDINMDLDILVPWAHQTETVGTQVLLAETVIVGKVPQTYVEVE